MIIMSRFFISVFVLLIALQTTNAATDSAQKFVFERAINIYAQNKNVGTVLNTKGLLIQSYHYMPNGKRVALLSAEKSTVNIEQNPFQYSGEYQDLESDLYYQRARYYSPSIQRFIQRDSYNLLNRYSYASGNPIMNIDPSGHLAIGGTILSSLKLLIGAITSFIPGLDAYSITLLSQGGLELASNLTNNQRAKTALNLTDDAFMLLSIPYALNRADVIDFFQWKDSVRAVPMYRRSMSVAKYFSYLSVASTMGVADVSISAQLVDNQAVKHKLEESAFILNVASFASMMIAHMPKFFAPEGLTKSYKGNPKNLFESLKSDKKGLFKRFYSIETKEDNLAGENIMDNMRDTRNKTMAELSAGEVDSSKERYLSNDQLVVPNTVETRIRERNTTL